MMYNEQSYSMKSIALFFLLITFAFQNSLAQQNSDDSLYKYNESIKYKTKLLKSSIVPLVLIGYGLTTIKSNGLYSSYQARNDIQKLFGNAHAPIDNYLVFSPYVEFGALLLFKVKCRNDFLNTSLLIVKSEILMLAIVFPLKFATHQERPDSYQRGLEGVPLSEREKNSNAFQSMPSGHTAEAFLAATVVYREYRYKSPWYGIGAYALATTVAAYRMINDKHWESDVFVGAGIGMLSANIVYATHKHRWGRKDVCLIPTFNGTNKGFAMVYKF